MRKHKKRINFARVSDDDLVLIAKQHQLATEVVAERGRKASEYAHICMDCASGNCDRPWPHKRKTGME